MSGLQLSDLVCIWVSVLLERFYVGILAFVCLEYSALMELDVRLPLCEVFAIMVILSCGDAFLRIFGVRLPHSTGVHFPCCIVSRSVRSSSLRCSSV